MPPPAPPLPPTVTALSASESLCDGNVAVTVTGTHLTGASAVRFGSVASSSVSVVSDTQLTVVSPPHAAGPVDVTVTTAGGTSATRSADQYTYRQLYVVDKGNSCVVCMDDMAGNGYVTYGAFGSGNGFFASPSGIKVAANGQIYVADRNNNRIVRIDDMTGTGFTSFGTFGNGAGSFNGPSGIALAASGALYITDGSNNRVVRIDDMAGTGFTSYGSVGSGVGGFSSPVGMCLAANGQIYVGDQSNNRVVRIDDMTGANFTTYQPTGGQALDNAQGIAIH